MLNKAKDLAGFKLGSLDGDIGHVKEFYFDDHYWTIRYLVADTGKWLTGRKVLISPHALGAVSEKDHDIAVNLTKRQIEESPSLDSDKPVSRQFEETYHAFYGWPAYWSGSNMWGAGPNLVTLAVQPLPLDESRRHHGKWDAHLRSTLTLDGYRIRATDGEIGHVVDFVIDDTTWAICDLVVDMGTWWPGKQILISPTKIENVNWEASKILVNLSREEIKQSPEFKREATLR